ncbi:hypothetical protein quinque_009307 [Culex quinquefasciatus]
MYAAAGGASLASRQARKKQAAQNNKNKASNQQILREKLAAKAATTPTKSKQFHQLPASYLKAPHQHHRKLSAGYTTVPGYDQHQKSLLPISEQSSSSGHGHHHHHPHHPISGHTPGQAPNAHPTYKPTGFREYDKLLSLPLQHTTADADGGLGRPLTPSPGLLERKCSVYRNRKLDDVCDERCYANYTTINNHQAQNQHPDDVYFGPGFPNGTDGQQQQGYVCKWDTEYYCCDAEHRQLGVCTCDHSEVT